jgi:FMN-dependent oxidoreductase (nitrilotriacetate monooxygenase family)
MTRQMSLGLFVLNTGHHAASWRDPSTAANPTIPFRNVLALAQTAERGLFDTVFLADSAASPDSSKVVLSRTDRATFIEPSTMAAALAVSTQKIGIVITQNTTYDQPYHVARRVLSLDHLSGGRIGCNLVTGVSESEARNFNHAAMPDHAARYRRAEEFAEVVLGLWASWDADAFPVDRESGQYLDLSKMRYLNHEGEHFRVRGPLNVARSPQHMPVMVQAGGSPPGRELAAKVADMVYSVQGGIDSSRTFYADLKGRMAAYGRTPDQLKIMPGLLAVVAPTRAEAEDKYAKLQDRVDPELGLAFLQGLLGPDIDLSRFPLDEKLPDDLSTNFGTTQLALLQEATKQGGLTLRQLTRFATGARGHLFMCGTAAEIADKMEERFFSGAADGFNLMPATIPGGVEDFVDMVVPELQRRKLMRTAYTGATLRAHLGLEFGAHA